MTQLESYSVTHHDFMPRTKDRSQSVSDRYVADCVVDVLDLLRLGSGLSCVVLEPRSESAAKIENQHKADRLTKYLRDLQVTTDDLNPEEVALVAQAWSELYAWSKQKLKVPKVGFGNEEGCVFVWENERIYFELEFVDGLVEFFTRSEVPGEAEKTRLAEDFATMEDFLKSQHASNLLAAFSID
jgi:hypothetical protein